MESLNEDYATKHEGEDAGDSLEVLDPNDLDADTLDLDDDDDDTSDARPLGVREELELEAIGERDWSREPKINPTPIEDLRGEVFAIPRFPGGTAPPAAATPTPVREEPRTAKPWSDESEDDDEPRYESMPADEDESEDDEDADELEAAGDHDDEDEDDDADDDDEAGDEEAGDELELDSLSDHVRESRSSGEMKRPPMPSRPVPERPASGQKQRPNDWVSMVTSIGAGSPKERDPSIISHNLAPDPIAREPRVEPDEPVRPLPARPRSRKTEDDAPKVFEIEDEDSPAPIAYEDAAEASIEPAAEEAPAALETHASARASDDFAMGPIVPDQPWSPESETQSADFAPEPDDDPVAVARTRTVRRPQWPIFREPKWQNFDFTPYLPYLPWAVTVLGLFAIGWWVGTHQNSKRPVVHHAQSSGLLRAVGLGGPIFTVRVTSDPAGAFIALDGKPTGIRSPADVELKPGPHRIQISIPEFGSTEFTVEGARGEHVALDAPLAGALSIRVPDLSPPVAVSVDGTPLGYAPLQIPDLSPGAHDVEFSSAGQPSWSQTVRIPVRGTAEVLARPFDLPGTGVLEVRANYSGEEGTQELKGAVVIVDGDKRGTTPLSLELQRGPHSVRAIYRGEESIVQVIDLPGGNQRFATFSFGAGVEVPRVRLDLPPGAIPRDRPTTVSAALQGVDAADVREMWLHVKGTDALWRRYAMTTLANAGGMVGVVVFPTAALGNDGVATYYVSALTATGEEFFTEVQNPARRAKRPKPVAATVAPSSSSSPVSTR